jgi:hypothetical protein
MHDHAEKDACMTRTHGCCQPASYLISADDQQAQATVRLLLTLNTRRVPTVLKSAWPLLSERATAKVKGDTL